MSTPDKTAAAPPEEAPALVAEMALGRALTLIHRTIPRLDELERSEDVQKALAAAGAQLEAARAAHARAMEALRPPVTDSEILAVIAAAIAVAVGRPHRVLDVQKSAPTVTWVNAWAIEGRFQHYSSHKVR